MKTTVITPPDGEPVSLSAVKDYLRIGHEGEDALVADLIAAARARLEAELDLALVGRTIRIEFSNWPSGLAARGVILRPGPLQALLAVRIVSGDAATDVTEGFVLSGGRLCRRPWSGLPALPTGARIEVEFTAGFGDGEAVPDDLQLAVKLLAAQGYKLRNGFGDEDAFPREVDDLLAPYMGVRL
ncbi:MAG: hypothetical protein ABJG15_18245 [Hyphomonadaceae bacterium]